MWGICLNPFTQKKTETCREGKKDAQGQSTRQGWDQGSLRCVQTWGTYALKDNRGQYKHSLQNGRVFRNPNWWGKYNPRNRAPPIKSCNQSLLPSWGKSFFSLALFSWKCTLAIPLILWKTPRSPNLSNRFILTVEKNKNKKGFGRQQHAFKSQLHHLLTVWPWQSHNFLEVQSLNHKMKIHQGPL